MKPPIRAIHPFGPPVGKWKSGGTVAETIAREKRRLAEQEKAQQQADAAYAAAAYARGKALKHCADIVRQHYRPPTLKRRAK